MASSGIEIDITQAQPVSMAATTELRSLVKTTIKPWKKSTTRPPFSDQTLVMMALALRDVPVRESKVQQWVENTFTYYKRPGLATGKHCAPTA